MQNNKSLIVWEKWVDPYGNNPDDLEWPGHDQEDILEDDSDDPVSRPFKKINAIATPMGIIPFNEYTDCSKIFNFLIGHTNFNITKHIAEILQNTKGVETLDIFTRYRFRISFGKAFDDREIMNTISSTIKAINNMSENES